MINTFSWFDLTVDKHCMWTWLLNIFDQDLSPGEPDWSVGRGWSEGFACRGGRAGDWWREAGEVEEDQRHSETGEMSYIYLWYDALHIEKVNNNLQNHQHNVVRAQAGAGAASIKSKGDRYRWFLKCLFALLLFWNRTANIQSNGFVGFLLIYWMFRCIVAFPASSEYEIELQVHFLRPQIFLENFQT